MPTRETDGAVMTTANAGVTNTSNRDTSRHEGRVHEEPGARLGTAAAARAVLVLLGGSTAGALAYRYLLRPRLVRWGVTEVEAQRILPGDAIIPDPATATTRAIEIDAPPEAVWPWLAQIGQKRGGFYSYDLIERWAGLDIRNAEEIHEEWQSLQVGDLVHLSPSNPMVVAQVESGHALVLFQDIPLRAGGFEEPFRWTWSFTVQALGEGSRLFVRTRVSWEPDGLTSLLAGAPIEAVHFLMERGMLLGIKRRAERHHAARLDRAMADEGETLP